MCSGNPVTINAGTGFTTYIWSNGQSTQSVSVTAAGVYTVTVGDINGCSASDNVAVITSSGSSINLGPDITIYEGGSTSIAENLSGIGTGGTYLWSPAGYLNCSNCSAPVAYPPTTTAYVLAFTDSHGCVSTDSIDVIVVPIGEAYFPNAFSPNGDGKNDVYRAHGDLIKYFTMKIFNRWGELVYSTNDYTEGWDGNYKGAKAPMSVYVYTATVTWMNNLTRDYKGNITLLR